MVPEERAPAYFELSGPSPFMQFAAPVRPEIAPMLPAWSGSPSKRRPRAPCVPLVALIARSITTPVRSRRDP